MAIRSSQFPTTNGHNVGRSGGSLSSSVFRTSRRLVPDEQRNPRPMAWSGGWTRHQPPSEAMLAGDQSLSEPVAGEPDLTLGLVERVERAYRGTDVLLIDGIQFLAQQCQDREEFFEDHMESERGGGAESDGVPTLKARSRWLSGGGSRPGSGRSERHVFSVCRRECSAADGRHGVIRSPTDRDRNRPPRSPPAVMGSARACGRVLRAFRAEHRGHDACLPLRCAGPCRGRYGSTNAPLDAQ